MKLLLTSSGLETKKLQKEFLKLLKKPIAENKILIMFTGLKPKHFQYIQDDYKFFSRLGFEKENIYTMNIAKTKKNRFKAKDFDVLLSCGGNTFYILDRVRKTGMDRFIKEFVKNNGVYVGMSAGSIIVHKTIEIAGYGSSGDPNEIKLKNLKGLAITNIAVFPHYKNRLKDEVDEFKKSVRYPVEVLRDKEALLLVGKTKRIFRIK